MNNEENRQLSFYRKLYNLREDGRMTMPELHDMIVGPQLKQITLSIRKLDAEGKEKKTRYQKLSLPLVAVSFLFPDERYNDQAGAPTGYALVDVDALQTPAVEYLERAKVFPSLALAYVSARGKGVHLIFRVATEPEIHADLCRALQDMVEATLGEPVDRGCTDLTRTSLLCWDEGCYYNPEAETFRLPAPPPARKKASAAPAGYAPPSEADRLAIYLDRVDDRLAWVKGQRHSQLVSLAYTLNRAGFGHNAVLQACIGRYAQADFDDREIRKVIDSIYNKSQAEHGANRREYTPTAAARSATGAKSANRDSRGGSKKETENESADIEAAKPPLPSFDYELFGQAPALLRAMVRPDLTGCQRDIAMMGGMILLSTLMAKVTGLYHEKKVAPTFFGYVIAPAGFGKGILNEQYKALATWHDYVRDNSRMRVRQYEEEEAAYQHNAECARKKGGQPTLTRPVPVKQMELDIPGSITQAKLTELLKANEHYTGVMFETELGVLVEAINLEYGKYVYLLNQIAQQEKIGRASLQNNVIQCAFPLASILTSGTFGQFGNFIQSTDDGLFSRFLAYTVNESPEWKDLTSLDDDPLIGNYYESMGGKLLEIGRFLDANKTFVCYTDAQRHRMNRRFRKLSKHARLFKGESDLSVVHRLGNYHFRICMLLTALRKAETKSTLEKVRVSDVDFDIAMMFVLTFQEHINALGSVLPENRSHTEFNDNDSCEKYFHRLPVTFETAEALELSESMGLKVRTVKRYLSIWVKAGLLVRVKRGTYRKGDNAPDD